jgi:phosphoenolpyruvate carboxylase
MCFTVLQGIYLPTENVFNGESIENAFQARFWPGGDRDGNPL